MAISKSQTRRVILVHWKHKDEPFQIFSNLKIFCAQYPRFNYNTLSNYLSKNKMPFENEKVRVERKVVQTTSARATGIAPFVNRVLLKDHDEEAEDLKYWLSKTPQERIGAVTFLRSQFMKPNLKMDKTYGRRVKMR